MKALQATLAPLTLGLLGFFLGQGQPETAPQQQEEKSIAEQVEEVAGEEDPYGMRTWYLALLKRGPQYNVVQGDERKEIFDGHFANMEALALDGYLRLAGPFGVPANAPKDAYAGLFLLDTKSLEEAKELCQTDPSIESKVFEVEILEWWGPSDITYRGDPTPPKAAETTKD